MIASRVELRVEGMDCADCVTHIESALRQLPGVQQVHISLAAQKTWVTFDANAVSLSQIEQAIRGTGYQPHSEARSETQKGRSLLHIGGSALLAAIALALLLAEGLERIGLIGQGFELIPAPIAIIAALVGGYPIFGKVLRALRARNVTPHFLMTLGVIASLATAEYHAAALIVFFMRLADFLEDLTVSRARRALQELVSVAPQRARVLRAGEESEVSPEEVAVGDLVVVRPGERIPVDGVVQEGHAAVNQAPITGESVTVEKGPGDQVFAASINELGLLKIQTTGVREDTTFGRIVRLVEEAEAAKARVQRFADRFTAYYVPVVLSLAVLTYLLSRNISASVAVLVVACACAIALATPVVVIASTGRAARQGILIKGGTVLEALAKINTVVFDKTGTITWGKPQVTDVVPLDGRSDLEVLSLAATIERYSEHILAKAIIAVATERGCPIREPQQTEVLPGRGVIAQVDGARVALGTSSLAQGLGAALSALVKDQIDALEQQGKSCILVVQEQNVVGLIGAADRLRPHVAEAVSALRRVGIRKVLLLTGDNNRVAAAIAGELGVAYYAEMLPEDKIRAIQELQGQGHRVAMVGDGINDAPALAAADVGIAMGIGGTAVAIEAADVALLREDLRLVPEAIRTGRRAFRTIKQNLLFTALYNVVGITLAAFGIVPPALAAAGQSLPDGVIMLNSSRLLRA